MFDVAGCMGKRCAFSGVMQKNVDMARTGTFENRHGDMVSLGDSRALYDDEIVYWLLFARRNAGRT